MLYGLVLYDETMPVGAPRSKGDQEVTKKDFELIAGVLADERASTTNGRVDTRDQDVPIRVSEIDRIAQRFAGILSQTNERFDADRFLKAAGVK